MKMISMATNTANTNPIQMSLARREGRKRVTIEPRRAPRVILNMTYDTVSKLATEMSSSIFGQ